MLSTYGSALVLCLLALTLGRGLLAAVGYERWSWLAPAAGYALVVIVADVCVRLPGRATTAAVVLVVLALVALAAPPLLRSEIGWPPLEGLGVAVVVLLAVAVPFVVNDRFGLLGVGFNNDPAFHLLWAEGLRHPAEQALAPFAVGYPLGPHATVAVLGQLLGVRLDRALDGLLIATPVLTSLTALEALRDRDPTRRWIVAVLAGLSYLLAAWYAQAAFKEPMLALFLLGLAVVAQEAGSTRLAAPVRTAVPAGVLLVGILYAYGYLGLAWPGITVGVLALLGLTAGRGWRHLRGAGAYLRPAVILAIVTAVVVGLGVAGDAHRILQFADALGGLPVRGAVGIPVSNLGNLVGPLHVLEAFGIWLGEDFRLVAVHPNTWPAFAAAVTAAALVWALWRRELVLGAALVACGIVYLDTRQTQSPYVAAKAMAVAGPFVALVAGRGLLSALDAVRARRPLTWAALPLAFLFLFLSVKSSYLALRGGQVAPSADFHELRSLRPVLGDGATLDTVFDEFFRWDLLGARATIPGIVGPVGAPYSPQKPWAAGLPLDFDDFEAPTLDGFRYVITTRTDAQSQPPPNFHVAARSARYEVWRREGPTPPHRVLPESGTYGAVLRCDTTAGRRLAGTPGTALVRPAPVSVSGIRSVPAGGSAEVSLPLPRGAWQVSLAYQSSQALSATVGGATFAAPATLVRNGPLWALGVVHSPGGPVRMRIHVHGAGILSSSSQVAHVTAIVAARPGAGRMVPLREACGRFVDWYVPG